MIKNKVIEFKEIEDGVQYDNCRFIEYNQDKNISDVDFNQCIFENDNFSNSEWLDVTFKNMDFSNKNFDESVIFRSDFENCRLTGISLINANLKKTNFKNSQLDFCNFNGSKLDEINLVSSSLNGMLFQEVSHQNVIEFNNCVLNEASFIDTKMSKIDLSNSHFDSLELTPELIRGITINATQLVMISDYLGIRLK